MKKFLVMLIIFTQTAFAAPSKPQAQGQEGGGGMAVQQGNDYILYDFIESGVDTSASVPMVQDKMGALAVLKQNLPFSDDVIEGVSSMMNLVYASHPAAAVEILKTLAQYVWQLPTVDVVDARDIGKTPIVLGNGVTVVPVAFRDDKAKVVWIRRLMWDGMNLFNRVGLIFHEVLYAISNFNKGQFNSYGARTVTGFIFNKIFSTQNYEKINGVFNMIMETRGLLNPVEFRYYISQDYQDLCNQNKTDVTRLFAEANKTLGSIVGKLKTAAHEILKEEGSFCNWGFDEKTDFRLKSKVLYGTRYEFLPEWFKNESASLKIRQSYQVGVQTMFNHCKRKDLYKLSDNEMATVKKLKETAIKIESIERNNLFYKCIVGEPMNALFALVGMDIP
jgi:hypothetical protein